MGNQDTRKRDLEEKLRAALEAGYPVTISRQYTRGGPVSSYTMQKSDLCPDGQYMWWLTNHETRAQGTCGPIEGIVRTDHYKIVLKVHGKIIYKDIR